MSISSTIPARGRGKPGGGTARTPVSTLTSNHMRVSVPNIPEAILRSANAAQARAILPVEAVDRIASFLSPGNVAVVTGAGVSVDSGIRAYRGAKGRYLNPNYK